MRSRRLGALVAGLVVLVACGTPVGVRRADPQSVHRTLTRSILSSGLLSTPTRNVLYRWDLVTRYDDDPAAALAALHGEVVAGRAGPDDLVALAELSFELAERTGERGRYLAAALYAYAFLFPSDPRDAPGRFDPRLRLACDLYNRGLTEGFAAADRSRVDIRAGTHALPFGTLEVALDSHALVWGERRFVDFVPIADLEVRGLPTRHRWFGLGAPLAASTAPLDPAREVGDFVAPWVKVARTAILVVPDAQRQLAGGRVDATLLLQGPGTPGVEIGGEQVPVELESTAALAFTLAESPVWAQEVQGFLRGVGVVDERARLTSITGRHHSGRIPVVLVHGTASSLGRWAQLLNELLNDDRIREHYEFWLFSYNTGNPVGYSAMLLRESLRESVASLDPEGRDPALRQMVVIGHSQGGLLTKMTVVDGGTRFWEQVSATPFDQADLRPATRDLLRRVVFVTPEPYVTRVIFIATPQHGSFFAGSRLAQWVAGFVTLPLDVVRTATDVVRLQESGARPFARRSRIATAVDNMAPGNPFITTLASLPVAPGVAAHSIVAVDGDGAVEDGNDGIVEYRSAHIEGVESELVVRSGHSCQDHPQTVGEVRRILLLHLDTLAASGALG